MISRKKIVTDFILVIILTLAVGLISYPKVISKLPKVYNALNELKINLGLDLQGGIHLEYAADLNQISSDKKDEAMQAIQDVIERRVNAFGVAEPIVYTTTSGQERRLVVELAGVKDINDAKNQIQETPFLEFKEQKEVEKEKKEEVPQEVIDQFNDKAKVRAESVLRRAQDGENFADLAKEVSEDPGSKENGGDLDFVKKGQFVPEFEEVLFKDGFENEAIHPELVETQFGFHVIKKIEERGEGEDKEIRGAHVLIMKQTIEQQLPSTIFVSSGLSGKNLSNSFVDFQNQGLTEPQVAIEFDDEGRKLFGEITKRNIGKPLAIFLDGQIVSAPTVQTEITDGKAVITGNFTIEEAKDLVRRLNEGALPVPIELISQQSVEASLGEESLNTSLRAGMWGLLLVIIFMIFYYRFLGIIASVSLIIYSGLMISIFKLSYFSPWQITLTLSGIAGFILSIGMAVDANILIFERVKEELNTGRGLQGSIEEGFKRAWTSIRDGNFSTIITSLILIWVGTGFVKGFAIILVIGVLASMFTAILITRAMLRFLVTPWMEDRLWLIARVKKNNNQEK